MKSNYFDNLEIVWLRSEGQPSLGLSRFGESKVGVSIHTQGGYLSMYPTRDEFRAFLTEALELLDERTE